MTSKFLISTYGCQLNEHDSERIAGQLVGRGMEATTNAEEADVVIFNTCTVRENADTKFYAHLGHLKTLREQNPNLVIAVGGCMAQAQGGAIMDRVSHVDLVFGTHNVGDVANLVDEVRANGKLVAVPDAPAPSGGDLDEALTAVRALPFAAWVTLQTGCNNTCAYCIVPDVRGPEVSRPFAHVIEEVEELARRGVTEVTFLGQNVNSYGRDLTGRSPLFAELLRAAGTVEGISRIRYTSPHPKDLRPEVLAAMAETEAVCEQLHLPLQSGSNRILTAMRRGYTAERYLEKIDAARTLIPDLAVTTDLIVGFPGETEEDFVATLEVAAEADWDSAFTFIFSPREGTRAAAMVDDFIDPEVVAERFARLVAVVERSALRRHEARVGRTEEVLVLGPSKTDPTMTSGRTRQGKLVHFSAPPSAQAAGTYVTATIHHGARHHLLGTYQELVAAPRHRRSIPLAVR
ncbi:MAG: tRNA (N6-isopentenyl adenosine(37)-C2)-methylthiotransferase MiaB [Actinomycetota bacterium]